MIDFLLGVLLPILLVSTGAFFFIYLKGYPFRTARKLIGAMLGQNTPNGTSSRKALLTALAGTLGVGNITGVAAAVAAGGAGALFWMWVCALFSMIIKYAETVLAMQKKKNGHGGAMYYLKSKWTAVLFALFCLACGFSMGNMVQVCAATDAVKTVLPRLGTAVPVLFSIFLFLVLQKGKKGVFSFACAAVPCMTLFYCLLCTAFLIRYRGHIPSALHSILQSAWSLRCIGGGLLGSSLILGLRYGAARGLISNEAGCGTAPIVHATSKSVPAHQGCLGIAEVFIDTLLICTLTGLCVLVAPVQPQLQGTQLIISIFSRAFGSAIGVLLAFCLFLFAFATAVCWFYYCTESMFFLAKDTRFDRVLSIFFSLLPFFACAIGEKRLFVASDLLVCLLAFLNLPALWKNRNTIREETVKHFR